MIRLTRTTVKALSFLDSTPDFSFALCQITLKKSRVEMSGPYLKKSIPYYIAGPFNGNEEFPKATIAISFFLSEFFKNSKQ